RTGHVCAPAPGAGSGNGSGSLRRRSSRRNRSGEEASGRQALAALGAAAGQDLAAAGRLHACTEAVVALALEVAGLEGALGGHGGVAQVPVTRKNRRFYSWPDARSRRRLGHGPRAAVDKWAGPGRGW